MKPSEVRPLLERVVALSLLLGLVAATAMGLFLLGEPAETHRAFTGDPLIHQLQGEDGGKETGAFGTIRRGSLEVSLTSLLISMLLGLVSAALFFLVLDEAFSRGKRPPLPAERRSSVATVLWGSSSTSRAWWAAALVCISPIHVRFMVSDSPAAMLLLIGVLLSALGLLWFPVRGRRVGLAISFLGSAVVVSQTLNPLLFGIIIPGYVWAAYGPGRGRSEAGTRLLPATLLGCCVLIFLARWFPSLSLLPSEFSWGDVAGGSFGAHSRPAASAHFALDYQLAYPLLLALVLVGAVEMVVRPKGILRWAAIALAVAWSACLLLAPEGAGTRNGLLLTFAQSRPDQINERNDLLSYLTTIIPLYAFTAAGFIGMHRRFTLPWRRFLTVNCCLAAMLLHYQILYHGWFQRLMF